jgi:hypothetical protein
MPKPKDLIAYIVAKVRIAPRDGEKYDFDHVAGYIEGALSRAMRENDPEDDVVDLITFHQNRAPLETAALDRLLSTGMIDEETKS